MCVSDCSQYKTELSAVWCLMHLLIISGILPSDMFSLCSAFCPAVCCLPLCSLSSLSPLASVLSHLSYLNHFNRCFSSFGPTSAPAKTSLYCDEFQPFSRSSVPTEFDAEDDFLIPRFTQLHLINNCRKTADRHFKISIPVFRRYYDTQVATLLLQILFCNKMSVCLCVSSSHCHIHDQSGVSSDQWCVLHATSYNPILGLTNSVLGYWKNIACGLPKPGQSIWKKNCEFWTHKNKPTHCTVHVISFTANFSCYAKCAACLFCLVRPFFSFFSHQGITWFETLFTLL